MDDACVPTTNGEGSELKFFSHYKKLEKITEMNKFKKISNSAFTNILKHSQKGLLTPCKLSLVKDGRPDSTLEASNYKLGK